MMNHSKAEPHVYAQALTDKLAANYWLSQYSGGPYTDEAILRDLTRVADELGYRLVLILPPAMHHLDMAVLPDFAGAAE